MKQFTRYTAIPVAAVCLLAGLYGCGDSSTTTPAEKNTAMVLVEGGTFTMGNDAVLNAKPARGVTVSDFYISKYELTFDEWDAYTKDSGKPDLVDINNAGRGQNPVYNIDWYDAIEYCNWRSVKEGLTPVYTIDKVNKDPKNIATDIKDPKKWTVTANWSANGYRLPTEAEWEYAAIGGKQSKGYRYAGSNTLKEVAWYGGKNAAKATLAGGAVLANFTTGTVTKKGDLRKIGSLKPNELGLYDMAGNVHEFVWDKYSAAAGPKGTIPTPYTDITTILNPKGHATGYNRVVFRGGNSGGPETCMLPYKRFARDATFNMCPTGLRLIRSK